MFLVLSWLLLLNYLWGSFMSKFFSFIYAICYKVLNFELGNNYLVILRIFCLDIHFLCHNFRIRDLKMACKKRSVLLTKARAASTAKNQTK